MDFSVADSVERATRVAPSALTLVAIVNDMKPAAAEILPKQ